MVFLKKIALVNLGSLYFRVNFKSACQFPFLKSLYNSYWNCIESRDHVGSTGIYIIVNLPICKYDILFHFYFKFLLLIVLCIKSYIFMSLVLKYLMFLCYCKYLLKFNFLIYMLVDSNLKFLMHYF